MDVVLRPAELLDIVFAGQGEDRFMAASNRTPASIGRYELRGELGRGGMGVVLRGYDPTLVREVVLKTIHPDLASDAVALERLQREARIAGKIDHPGICPVLDLVVDDGRDYVVLPFIAGRTLAELMREEADGSSATTAASAPSTFIDFSRFERSTETTTDATTTSPMSSTEPSSSSGSGIDGDGFRARLRIFERIAHAAHAAHEAGIVHRDLKPGNVIVRADGEPVVLDFGLAFEVATPGALRSTEEGTAVGTIYYMAPEQVRGDLAAVDRRVDVYALGVMLYEAITGRRPFDHPGREMVYASILHGDPTRPRRLDKDIPRDIEAVCLKAMAFDPGDRYATTLDLAEDLRRVRNLEPTQAQPVSGVERLWRGARRNPTAAAAFALAAAMGLVALMLWYGWRQSDETLREQNDFMRVFERYRSAIERGEEPRTQDEAILIRQLGGDEAVLSVLRYDVEPFAEAEWGGRGQARDKSENGSLFGEAFDGAIGDALAGGVPGFERRLATPDVSVTAESQLKTKGARSKAMPMRTLVSNVQSCDSESMDRINRATVLLTYRRASEALSELDGIECDLTPRQRRFARQLEMLALRLSGKVEEAQRVRRLIAPRPRRGRRPRP